MKPAFRALSFLNPSGAATRAVTMPASSAPMSSPHIGLESRFVQVNHLHNIHCGTLRGMHFQQSPHGEVKLVRALRGAVHDVIIDLRDGSRTHGRWEGFDLTAENGHMLYVPAGFAHGFQTLEDNTDITYMVSHRYVPEAEAGVRWEDPTFAIDWPLPVTVISEKDSTWPLIDPQHLTADLARCFPETRSGIKHFTSKANR
jgi:dTDP-4-dehydrorhamnose 3,5-epimerase